jgi:hypothetical protein
MRQEQASKPRKRYRLELIDNWHKGWKHVLAFVESRKQKQALMIDSDGWLAARQVLFVAFTGHEVAGFICFHVQPEQDAHGEFILNDGKAVLEAKVDGFAVDGQFDAEDVRDMLFQAARSRALDLNCRHFRD